MRQKKSMQNEAIDEQNIHGDDKTERKSDRKIAIIDRSVFGFVALKTLSLWVALLVDISFSYLIVYVLFALPMLSSSRNHEGLWGLQLNFSQVITLVAALVIIRAAASLSASVSGTHASEKVKLSLRSQLYRHVFSLGNSYRSAVKSSDIVQSLGEGVEQVQSFYELFAPHVLYTIIAPITLWLVVLHVNVWSSFVLLMGTPLVILIVGLVAMRASRLFKKYWGKYTDMGATFLDSIQGLETLSSYDADGRALQKMSDQAETFRVMTMKVLQIQLRSLAAMDFVAYGGAAAGIGVGLWQFTLGAVSTRGLIFIILLSAAFFIPVRQLGSYFHVALNGITSTQRIFNLLKSVPVHKGALSVYDEHGSEQTDETAKQDGLDHQQPLERESSVTKKKENYHKSDKKQYFIDITLKNVNFSYAELGKSHEILGKKSDNTHSQSEPQNEHQNQSQLRPQDKNSYSNSAYQSKEQTISDTANTPFHQTSRTLDSISCYFPSHKLTAIVGFSGSGKSTIAHLLSGQLSQYSGSAQLHVLAAEGDIDATSSDLFEKHLDISQKVYELRDVQSSQLASSILVISARSHLFTGSVRDNLLMAKPDANDDELWDVLEKAHIADFVRNNPHGLDMPLLSSGSNISGGQRQRIAIARALLADAPVYIFDEATSSVDGESEKAILLTIRELALHKTVIMITHRLSNAFAADSIIVMDNGKAMQGSYDELMIKSVAFKKIADSQLLYEDFASSLSQSSDKENNIKNSKTKYNTIQLTSKKIEKNTTFNSDSHSSIQWSTGKKEELSHIAIIARLLKQVKVLHKAMVVAIICGVLGHISATLLPVFGAIALFALLGLSIFGINVFVAVGAMLVCALMRGLMRYAEQYMNHYMAFRILALLRIQVFEELRRLGSAQLAQRGMGDLIAMATSDIELLEIFFAHTISPTGIAVVTTLIYTAILAFLDPLLIPLLLIAHIIIGLIIPLIFSRKVDSHARVIRRLNADIDNIIVDDMRGIDEIIAFSAQQSRLQRMERKTRNLWVQRRGFSIRQGSFEAVSQSFVLILTITSAFMVSFHSSFAHFNANLSSAHQFMGNAHSPLAFAAAQGVVAVVLYASSFGPTLALSALPTNLSHTFAAARRIFSLFDHQPYVVENGDQKLEFTRMALKNVDFSYDGGKKILENVDLTIPAHGITAIEGASGRGKTTLLRLLMRYYDPTAGIVAFSQADLRDVDMHYRKAQQAFMQQETYIFDGTIRDNLLVARPDATEEELLKALKDASLDQFVADLPLGLDTPVGELGDRLSEGEKQRLGFARLIIRRSPLILLDEPTSRLDGLNESVLLHSLQQLSEKENVSIVMVTHRPSTSAIAQTIVKC